MPILIFVSKALPEIDLMNLLITVPENSNAVTKTNAVSLNSDK